MSVERYIRAYNKGIGTLIFEIKLPANAITFLSTVPFLVNEDDPLLYYCYELTGKETDFIHQHFFLKHIADTDYFDYMLECDSAPQESKVKTKEELLKVFNTSLEDSLRSLIFSVTNDFERRIPKWELIEIQDLCYRIYHQGVSDERTANTR